MHTDRGYYFTTFFAEQAVFPPGAVEFLVSRHGHHALDLQPLLRGLIAMGPGAEELEADLGLEY